MSLSELDQVGAEGLNFVPAKAEILPPGRNQVADPRAGIVAALRNELFEPLQQRRLQLGVSVGLDARVEIQSVRFRGGPSPE